MPRLKPPRQKQEEQPIIATTPIDQPVEIVLDDDPVEHVEVSLAEPPIKVESKPDADALKTQVDAAKQAEELQRRLTEAQRQSDENARLAREREHELQRERGDREDAQYNSVLTAIAAQQSTLDKAESDYAAYASANDWANASKAQRVMSEAAARLDRLTAGKDVFEERREEAKRAAQTAPRPVPQPPSFEERIKALPSNAQSWLRTHPEFINDASKNGEIQAAHSYIVQRKGVAAFSDAYFDALDTEFGFKKPPESSPVPAPSPQPRKSMPMTAPVSRDVPSVASGTRTQNSITLTAEERAIARNSFGPIKDADGNMVDMTNEQKERLYAQNKAKLQRMRASGEYRQTTEQTG
jgi:hypothetical protein